MLSRTLWCRPPRTLSSWPLTFWTLALRPLLRRLSRPFRTVCPRPSWCLSSRTSSSWPLTFWPFTATPLTYAFRTTPTCRPSPLCRPPMNSPSPSSFASLTCPPRPSRGTTFELTALSACPQATEIRNNTPKRPMNITSSVTRRPTPLTALGKTNT